MQQDPSKRTGEIIGMVLVAMLFYVLLVLCIKLTQWLF
jgi:hypothetical protein